MPSLRDFIQIESMRVPLCSCDSCGRPLPKLQQQPRLSPLSDRIQVRTVTERPSFHPCGKASQGAGCRGRPRLRPHSPFVGLCESSGDLLLCACPRAPENIKPQSLAALSARVTAAAARAFPYFDDNWECISERGGNTSLLQG